MNTWLTRLALKKEKKLEKGRVSAEEPGSPRGRAAASGEAWGGQTGGQALSSAGFFTALGTLRSKGREAGSWFPE